MKNSISAKDETSQMDFNLWAHRWGRDKNRFWPKPIAELIDKSFKLKIICDVFARRIVSTNWHVKIRFICLSRSFWLDERRQDTTRIKRGNKRAQSWHIDHNKNMKFIIYRVRKTLLSRWSSTRRKCASNDHVSIS